VFTDSLGQEFRKAKAGMALLRSTMSGASTGIMGYLNIWASNGWDCNSWGWRSPFSESSLIHVAYAWAGVA